MSSRMRIDFKAVGFVVLSNLTDLGRVTIGFEGSNSIRRIESH